MVRYEQEVKYGREIWYYLYKNININTYVLNTHLKKYIKKYNNDLIIINKKTPILIILLVIILYLFTNIIYSLLCGGRSNPIFNPLL